MTALELYGIAAVLTGLGVLLMCLVILGLDWLAKRLGWEEW